MPLTIKLNLDHAVAKRLKHGAVDCGSTVSAAAQRAATDGINRLPDRFRRAGGPHRRVLAFLDPAGLNAAREIAARRHIPLSRVLARAVSLFLDEGQCPDDIHPEGHDLSGNRRYSAVYMEGDVYRRLEYKAAKRGLSRSAVVTAAVTKDRLGRALAALQAQEPRQTIAVTLGDPVLSRAKAMADHACMPLTRVVAAAVEEGVRGAATTVGQR